MIEHVYPVHQFNGDAPIKGFFQYIHAGNGDFIRANRAGLRAMIKISDDRRPGCVNLMPFINLEQKVGIDHMGYIYRDFVEHLPNERLAWVLSSSVAYFPPQTASPGSVRPRDFYDPMIEHALVDIHSHNTMEAYFSSQDDLDESKGFRVYIVIGRVGSDSPQIRARVGIFGHFMDVPIQTVAELPAGLNLEDLYGHD